MAGVFDDLPDEPTTPARAGAFDDLPDEIPAGGVDTVATDALAQSMPAHTADTVQTDPLAALMPYRPPPATMAQMADYAAGRQAGYVQPQPQAPAPTAAQVGQEYVDLGKGFSQGILPGLLGIPGDTESTARIPLSLLGASRQNEFFPTTSEIENEHFGQTENPQIAAGRILGNLSALPAASSVLGGIGSLAKLGVPTVLPGPANPQLVQLAQKSESFGVPIRPGQMSPSQFVKVADDQLSRMPLTGYSNVGNPPDLSTLTADELEDLKRKQLKISPEAQYHAFTRAVSNTFGEDAPALTQDVMAQAQNRITQQMDDVLSRNSVALTPDLTNNLQAIKDAATEALDEDAKPVVTKIDKIISRMNSNYLQNGQYNAALTGEQYLNWRQRGGLLSSLTDSQNPTISFYGQQIRRTLDNAFQDQAPADDGAALAQARQQYRNLKTVEPLAAKAPDGNISPALLLGAVRSEFPNFATKGAGDLGDLARIGQAFLKSPPNSTTAERGAVVGALRNPVKAIGELAGMPLAATVGRGLSSAINSPTYAARLANGGQVAGGIGNASVLGNVPSITNSPVLQYLLASRLLASTQPAQTAQ